MGIGKYLLGGACAVGAIIAAPVVLPAAGAAIMGSTVTGVAGITVGATIATAGTTGVIASAATAGAAGLAVGTLKEKKDEKIYNDGKIEGIVEASKEYEEKFKVQANDFYTKKKNWEDDKEEYEQLISDMEDYICELEKQKDVAENSDDVLCDIENAKNELLHLRSLAV